MLISSPLKRFQKSAPKQSYKQTNLENMNESEKSAYLRHIYVITFFHIDFFQLFQWIRH